MKVAARVALVQPSSASVERVFSLYDCRHSLDDGTTSITLVDKVRTGLMEVINSREHVLYKGFEDRGMIDDGNDNNDDDNDAQLVDDDEKQP